MYTYEKALVRDLKSSKRWIEAELANVPVVGIFDKYREVVLVLSNSTLNHFVTLNLKDVNRLFSQVGAAVTVSQWLTALGNAALPTVAGYATIKNVTVKYKDAFAAGYNANLAFGHGNPFSEVSDGEKDDILLTKPKVPYKVLYDNCLISVNGMIHRTDYDFNGLYIKDAGKSFRIANQHHIGILNFKDIGTLKCISITEEMLYTPHKVGKFKDAVYIHLPEDIGNRIVMLVIGGYLHLMDSNFHCINDRVIKIDMANYPLLPRFYESKKLIDLSKMIAMHDSSTNNPSHVSLNDMFKDESISAYLSMSQSFVVLLDTDNLYMEKHKLGYAHLPGRYFTGAKPVWPARTELGRLPEYIAINETGVWTLAVQDNFSTRYMNETTNYETNHSVDSSRVSQNPVFYAKGYLLEIGTDKLEMVPTPYVQP